MSECVREREGSGDRSVGNAVGYLNGDARAGQLPFSVASDDDHNELRGRVTQTRSAYTGCTLHVPTHAYHT